MIRRRPSECKLLALEFIRELNVSPRPLRKTNADERTRHWAKAHGIAAFGPHGWFITRKGRRVLDKEIVL